MSAPSLLESSWERLLRSDLTALVRHQDQRWQELLRALQRNDFYRQRIGSLEPSGHAKTDLANLPVLSKQELVDDQAAHAPFGCNLSCDPAQLVRFHQTSGTTGQPLRWPDSQRNWDGFLRSWQRVFEGAGVSAADRVLVAFSFGPFIGFWGAFEAAQAMGALAISGGAQTSLQRLEQIQALDATVLVCTPTYALRLAEVAREQHIDLRNCSVRATIHAGEPGASVPAVRRQLEELWGATCWDHAGATEIGAWGYPARTRSANEQPLCGLFVDETSFIAEFRDTTTGEWFAPAESAPTDEATDLRRGELILTALERPDRPVIRYATGALVQPVRLDGADDRRLFLPGGVLARIDDMFVVRGVNVYPAAIDGLVRQLPQIVEYRATVRRDRQMSEMQLEIEVAPGSDDVSAVVDALALLLRERLSLRVPITVAEPGALPRFELKAKRFQIRDT